MIAMAIDTGTPMVMIMVISVVRVWARTVSPNATLTTISETTPSTSTRIGPAI